MPATPSAIENEKVNTAQPFQMIIKEPKVGLITNEELTDALSPEVAQLLTEHLSEGDMVLIKGSVLDVFEGLPIPADMYGKLHPNRRTDIDIFTETREVYSALVHATSKQQLYPDSSSLYTENRKLRFENGISVDLNNGETVARALIQNVQQLISTIEELEDTVLIHGTQQALVEELKKVYAELTVEPFRPIYALHCSGFLPLESVVLEVSKDNGILQAELKDPYQIVQRAQIREQSQIHAINSERLNGIVFFEDQLQYSPYYWALVAEYARATDNRVFFENSDFIYYTYANILKLARKQVESNITLASSRQQIESLIQNPSSYMTAISEYSPIQHAALSIGTEDLVLRPSDPLEYKEIIESLRKKAQLEFARAAASDPRHAIRAFFLDFPFGGLIYEQFRFDHYTTQDSLGDANTSKGDRTYNFMQRLQLIFNQQYPLEQIPAITTINPDTPKPLMFNREASAKDMSEVIAIVLAADGYSAENCNDVLNELIDNWAPDRTLTDGWFYGSNEVFDATLNRENIVNHLQDFQALLESAGLAAESSQQEPT